MPASLSLNRTMIESSTPFFQLPKVILQSSGVDQHPIWPSYFRVEGGCSSRNTTAATNSHQNSHQTILSPSVSKGYFDLNYLLCWCREGGSNPHDRKGRRILSPLRLPVPPSRLGWDSKSSVAAEGGVPGCVAGLFRVPDEIHVHRNLIVNKDGEKRRAVGSEIRAGEGIVPLISTSFPCGTRGSGTRLACAVCPANWTSRSPLIVAARSVRTAVLTRHPDKPSARFLRRRSFFRALRGILSGLGACTFR